MAITSLGPGEILLIALVILLLFGAKKLPELARSVGRASKEFKSGIEEGAKDEEPEPPTTNASASDTPSERAKD